MSIMNWLQSLLSGKGNEAEWETLLSKGMQLNSEGKVTEAEKSYIKALNLAERLEKPELVFTSLRDIGLFYCGKQKYELSESYLRRSLEEGEKEFGFDHYYLYPVVDSLIAVSDELGKQEKVDEFKQKIENMQKGSSD